jgi:hypothetical protein
MMSKKDFVVAWLLASQAGGRLTEYTDSLIQQAEEMWELLEERYETNG